MLALEQRIGLQTVAVVSRRHLVRSTAVVKKLEIELITTSSIVHCGGPGAVIIFPPRRLLTGGATRDAPSCIEWLTCASLNRIIILAFMIRTMRGTLATVVKKIKLSRVSVELFCIDIRRLLTSWLRSEAIR